MKRSRNPRKKSNESPKTGLGFQIPGSKVLFPVLLGLVVLLILALRWRLLGVPLERDEGEYAYMGQLMLRGFAPYELAYNMKYPGTNVVYAVMMTLFGQTTEGVHLGLAVLNMASVVLLYFIGREFLSPLAAWLAALVFGFVSLGSSVLGFAFHANHAVTFFALAGIFMVLRGFRKDKAITYLWAGLFFGIAVVMKQSGVFLGIFGFLAIFLRLRIIDKKPWRQTLGSLLYFAGGSVLPILLMFSGMYLTGGFDKFWFWTYTYLKEYGTQATPERAWTNLSTQGIKVVNGYYGFWILAGVGLILSFFRPGKKEDKWMLWMLLFFAVLTIVPGLYFRRHYFIPLLPVIGLFVGLMLDYLGKLSFIKPVIGKLAGLILILVASGIALQYDWDYLFVRSPNVISRSIYGYNPFPEAVEISKYIKTHSRKDDYIAVLGSEPEIFFYTKRLSSTGYIYTYNMMELHDHNLIMQKEMAAEIEKRPPEILVFVNVSTSWLRKEEAPLFIFSWMKNYTGQFYEVVGLVDMNPGTPTQYLWDSDAVGVGPSGKYYIQVFRRRK